MCQLHFVWREILWKVFKTMRGQWGVNLRDQSNLGIHNHNPSKPMCRVDQLQKRHLPLTTKSNFLILVNYYCIIIFFICLLVFLFLDLGLTWKQDRVLVHCYATVQSKWKDVIRHNYLGCCEMMHRLAQVGWKCFNLSEKLVLIPWLNELASSICERMREKEGDWTETTGVSAEFFTHSEAVHSSKTQACSHTYSQCMYC